MLIVGESINGTIPAVGQAIAARDEVFLRNLARQQVECGAHMLDVNAGGAARRDEVEDLVWAVQTVQAVVDVPLVLDSPSPEALQAAMAVYHGQRPILSSITAERKRLESYLPLLANNDCGLVSLCMGDEGIPKTAEGRLDLARTLVERTTEAGVRPEDLYLDPAVMTISADAQAGVTTLATLRLIRQHFPEVRTICGVSNVSFGLPKRRLLNRTFLAMLIAMGLDAFLVNVRDKALMATVWAANALVGKDEWCREYLKAYRVGTLNSQ